jgi:uncharacterized protein YecT (DUF1311 family)
LQEKATRLSARNCSDTTRRKPWSNTPQRRASWFRPRACATLARVRRPAAGRLSSVVRHQMPICAARSLLFALLLAWSVTASALDCGRATGTDEKLICSSRSLLNADEALNLLYTSAIQKAEQPASLRDAQRRWLVEERAACRDVDCLTAAYASRQKSLKSALIPWCKRQSRRFAGSWVRVGSNGLFEEFSAGQDGGFDSWLHHRPEVSGGTWKVSDCTIVISAHSFVVTWVLVDLTGTQLRVREDADVGIATYRLAR